MLADRIREESIDELALRLRAASERIADLKQRLKKDLAPFELELDLVQDELHNRYETLIRYEAAKKPEPSGKVSCQLNRHRLVANIPKKVTWNQHDLYDVARVLDREEFAGLFGKLKVSERAYKDALEKDYGHVLAGAREVEFDTPEYTIEVEIGGLQDPEFDDVLEGTVGSFRKPTGLHGSHETPDYYWNGKVSG